MSQAFESIAQGLREALALSQGEKVAALIHHPDEIDVAKFGQQLIQFAPDSGRS